jgi:hypothetical protein
LRRTLIPLIPARVELLAGDLPTLRSGVAFLENLSSWHLGRSSQATAPDSAFNRFFPLSHRSRSPKRRTRKLSNTQRTMHSTMKNFRNITALAAALALCIQANAAVNNNGGNCGGGGGNGGGGNNLHCDAGGPYVADCNGGTITIHLDGTDSSGATTWTWSSECANALFDDIHSPTPTLTFTATPNSGCNCSHHCTVHLTVGDGHNTKSCSSTVEVHDTIPPVITCPDTGKGFCGMDTSPATQGFATATDNCDPNVTITYSDHIELHDCPADRFDHVILRKWKAKDHCGNKSECTQAIDVLKVPVTLDIMPGQCPNVFNPNDCGYLPITILGSASFDVTKIKWDSVRLYAENCTGGPVKPKQFQVGDVSTPYSGLDQCGCNTLGGDGILDLTLKFKRSEVACALGLSTLPSGSVVHVVVVGKLEGCDTCKFIGTDCLFTP